MNERTRKSFHALIRGAWDATIDERPRLLLFTILFVIANSLDLLGPWAIGYTLGIFVQFGFSDQAFRLGFLGLFAWTLLRVGYALCHHYARYVQNRVAYSARMNIMSKIFDALLRFPLRWHVSHHSGENLSKLGRSTGAIDSMIGTYIWQIIEGTVKIIFAASLIFYLDVWVATNVLVMSTITIGLMIFFNSRLISRIRRNNTFGNKLNSICVDYLSNIVTVKTLGVERAATRHLRAQKPEGLRLSQSISGFMELKWGSTTLGYALVISTSLIIYFRGHRGSVGAIDVAQVYVLLNYLDRINQAIGSFTGYYSGLIEAATAYEDASEVLEQAAKFPDRVGPGNLNESWNFVSAKKLNFAYVEGEKVGLNNVKVEFRRGEKIALVGQSGSGKSTLLKVFGGLITPDSYSLATDLQSALSIEDFQSQCLLIPQEPEIFTETLLYNLTMGEEFDAKEISFFVSLCKLDNLVNRLPRGLDSSLAEKGLNLSVGERQRIALARGLLRAKQREVFLLDEPTSSLDPKTEKEIFLGLFYHFGTRTILSSCHRLNLIPLFDRIVLMAQSSVLEVGTFAELIELRGHFFRMWEDYERDINSSGSAPLPPPGVPAPGPAAPAPVAADA